ncbi:hypothetical protein HPG69_016089 [Diceros bicornis minor]|uniref:Heat shock factor 2-binding protein n=1 Tax=Diceros bicornis minor TaxID=77932 RepID=A0A7J7FHM5_DICBM|nr:hypothetical protein HPG69_016089 [Diceros bicornis minor]
MRGGSVVRRQRRQCSRLATRRWPPPAERHCLLLEPGVGGCGSPDADLDFFRHCYKRQGKGSPEKFGDSLYSSRAFWDAPVVLGSPPVSCLGFPSPSQTQLERKQQELEQLRMDCEHFKARLETVQADSVREKKEKLTLRQQLNEAKQQLLQQAEYCTEMGAAACTLLWGVSSSEEVVKAILGGDKALKFFNITGQTMESFVKSLDGDVKELDSNENQFVFALAGIVTNVAAIACGREFLVNSSRVLLDTILQLLGDLKPGQCTKLKVYGG